MLKMKKIKKLILIIISLVILIVVGFSIAIISIEKHQYSRNQEIIQKIGSKNKDSKTLVTFFSRSGNTELMARKIGELKNAPVIPIKSEKYKIGIKGWINALSDARDTVTEITPSEIDLSSYDTIYIGSPIWLYSPAPPVWEFAGNNDFLGKKVILFNTMNSKFEQKYIDDFKKLIANNNGVFEKHIYINRGRMTRQISEDSLIEKVETLIE